MLTKALAIKDKELGRKGLILVHLRFVGSFSILRGGSFKYNYRALIASYAMDQLHEEAEKSNFSSS